MFDAVLALCYAKFGNAVVQLLLLDGVQALATIVEGPTGINTIATIVRRLTGAAGDVVTIDNRICLAVGAVYDTLADTCRQTGKQGCFRSFHIHFGAFRTDTVTLQGDVVLQGIVNAGLQVPLRGERRIVLR